MKVGRGKDEITEAASRFRGRETQPKISGAAGFLKGLKLERAGIPTA